MAVLPATSGTLLEKGASGVCVRRAVRTAPKTLRPVDWTSVCCVLLRGLDATKAVPPSGAVSDVPQGENRGGGAAVPLPTAAPRLEVAHTSLKPASGATSDRDPAGGTVPTAQRNQPWCLAARMICGTPRQPGVREAPHNMPSSAVPGTHGGNPAPGTRATSPPWHSYEGCASVYLEFRE